MGSRNRAPGGQSVVERYLNPVSGVGSQNQWDGWLFPAPDRLRLVQRYKQQAVRVMVAESVVADIALDGCEFEFSHHCTFRGRHGRQEFFSSAAQGWKAFLWLVIGPDDAPQTKPEIVRCAVVVQVVSAA